MPYSAMTESRNKDNYLPNPDPCPIPIPTPDATGGGGGTRRELALAYPIPTAEEPPEADAVPIPTAEDPPGRELAIPIPLALAFSPLAIPIPPALAFPPPSGNGRPPPIPWPIPIPSPLPPPSPPQQPSLRLETRRQEDERMRVTMSLFILGCESVRVETLDWNLGLAGVEISTNAAGCPQPFPTCFPFYTLWEVTILEVVATSFSHSTPLKKRLERRD